MAVVGSYFSIMVIFWFIVIRTIMYNSIGFNCKFIGVTMFVPCKFCGSTDIEFVIREDKIGSASTLWYYCRCKKCNNRVAKPTMFKQKAYNMWNEENS